MRGGKPGQQGLAPGGEPDLLAPAIRGGGRAAHELPAVQAVDETDGAVMTELQAFGQFADRGKIPAG